MKTRSSARRAGTLAVLVIALFIAAVGPVSVVRADPPDEVDQSLLVPTTLDSSFAPFTCRVRRTGPVCTGERYVDTGWEAVDFPCDVQLHNRFVSYRHQTRYYDHDHLNYDRTFRSRDTDYFSTSAGGPVTATIATNVRFTEPFAVPGDDSTITIITTGRIWDIRPVDGPALVTVVGTVVEPPGGTATFTGHATRDGVTTRFEDAALDDVLSEEEFFDAVCRAASGG
jgi:hypothetical protein